jgi:DNA-directed RNA polymerase specialized sigma24 family protein
MARNKSNNARESSTDKYKPEITALDKIARLLGAIAVKEMEQKADQVVFLRRVGFSVAEVASILGMTENHVSVATLAGKKKIAAKTTKKG